MTDINKLIAELERLEKEATPGPWKHKKSVHGNRYRYVELGDDGSYTTLELEPGDARLIAAMRNRLLQILTALRQARAAEGLAEALRELLVPVKLVGETMWGPAGHRYPGYEATVPSASVKIAEAALKAYEEGKKEPAK